MSTATRVGAQRASGVRSVLRDNGIGLAFGGLFLVVLALQSVAGWRDFDAQQASDGL